MQPVVQFDNVTKSYGKHVAVENLNLSIEAGKFVTLTTTCTRPEALSPAQAQALLR